MVKKVSVSDLSESLVGKYSMSQAEAEASEKHMALRGKSLLQH